MDAGSSELLGMPEVGLVETGHDRNTGTSTVRIPLAA